MLLYCTADQIGAATGGGTVARHESEALAELGPCTVIGCDRLSAYPGMVSHAEPWHWDERARATYLDDIVLERTSPPQLAHFYAGTFGQTVASLRRNGCKVVYTIAAHDRGVSRSEHEKLGLPFPYTHLTEEPLWQRYIEGYRLADVIVCPGEAAARVVRDYGPEFREKRITIIPHGCTIPEQTTSLPARFTVGYLGSFGADKGVRYLLEAWQKLNYKDAVLVLGGIDSQGAWANHLINRFAPNVGPILQLGWVKDVSKFYDGLNLYVQPSATEGFGIEVVEAMAHGRPVLCSDGAGAADTVPTGWTFRACDTDSLANKIELCRNSLEYGDSNAVRENWSLQATKYTWDKVRAQYQSLWRSML